jgi:hypothetical protein
MRLQRGMLEGAAWGALREAHTEEGLRVEGEEDLEAPNGGVRVPSSPTRVPRACSMGAFDHAALRTLGKMEMWYADLCR